jgi:heterodisulfide reductase subunit A
MADKKDAKKEDIKVGVFVCQCGINIGGVVDCDAVAEYAATLPNVVYVKNSKYTCSDAGQQEIREGIKEHKLNRIVVAACSPRLHEPTFRKTVEDSGLNPFLFQMANIREHCSWVHMKEPEKATERAKEQTRMAVARARLLEPQEKLKVKVTKKALVIGGGIAGIQASLDLADQGFKTYLVEKEPTIGGMMAQLDKTFPTQDCSICIEAPKMVDVSRHPNIEMMTYSEVKAVEGYVGNFKITVEKKPRFVKENECTGCGLCAEVCPIETPNEFDMGMGARKAIYVSMPQSVPLVYTIDKEHCIGCGECVKVCSPNAIDFDQEPKEVVLDVGTVIVAIGSNTYDPSKNNDYGYNDYQNVITGLELERLINASGPTHGELLRPSDGKKPRKVAFIQCVGSRDEKSNIYCSNMCCMYAMKQSQLLLEKYPGIEVYIYYMDIRATGKGYEEFYRRARTEGITFIRGRPSAVVEDPKTKDLTVVAVDTSLGRQVDNKVDLVVLSVGLVPNPDTEKLKKLFNLTAGPGGFFLEAHPKLKPVDTLIDGVFIAGTCQGPKDIPASVTQGSAAASRAAILLSQGEVEIEPITAYVDQDLCIGCRICERICEFSAVKIEEKRAIVNEALCKGCGTCVGGCPTGAIQQRHFKDEQIVAEISAAFSE